MTLRITESITVCIRDNGLQINVEYDKDEVVACQVTRDEARSLIAALCDLIDTLETNAVNAVNDNNVKDAKYKYGDWVTYKGKAWTIEASVNVTGQWVYSLASSDARNILIAIDENEIEAIEAPQGTLKQLRREQLILGKRDKERCKTWTATEPAIQCEREQGHMGEHWQRELLFPRWQDMPPEP